MLRSTALAVVCVMGLATPATAEDVRQAIEQANARFVEAFKAGDAATIASLYTETAKVLPPDATEVAVARRFRTCGRAGSTTASRT